MVVEGAMALAFTKTMAVIGLAQMVVRLPLTYVVDPVPYATGGVFWGGVAAVPMLLIIGIIGDAGIGLWWLIRTALKR